MPSSILKGTRSGYSKHSQILRGEELHINIPAIVVESDCGGECAKWCFDEASTIVGFKEAVVMTTEAKAGELSAPLMRIGVCGLK